MSQIITVGRDPLADRRMRSNRRQTGKECVSGARSRRRGTSDLRKTSRRAQVLEFFGQLPPCVVAMEACGGAHVRGREIGKLGHDVRLIPPACVKPFVKRQKNDMANAEVKRRCARRCFTRQAMFESPRGRVVPVKCEYLQGAAGVFRGPRFADPAAHPGDQCASCWKHACGVTQGHLTEFGEVVPKGTENVPRLVTIVGDLANGLPDKALATLQSLVGVITGFNAQIATLDIDIRQPATENEVARRLMTVPGIGPLIATALATLAPPPETFRRGRDFAAWLGLVPRKHSPDGAQRFISGDCGRAVLFP